MSSSASHSASARAWSLPISAARSASLRVIASSSSRAAGSPRASTTRMYGFREEAVDQGTAGPGHGRRSFLREVS